MGGLRRRCGGLHRKIWLSKTLYCLFVYCFIVVFCYDLALRQFRVSRLKFRKRVISAASFISVRFINSFRYSEL